MLCPVCGTKHVEAEACIAMLSHAVGGAKEACHDMRALLETNTARIDALEAAIGLIQQWLAHRKPPAAERSMTRRAQ